MLSSCIENNTQAISSKRYFDLKGYFEKEALRLSRSHMMVDKSVSKNAEKENRQLIIKNWAAEFGLFTGSDINKPAWKDSYRITSGARETRYKSLQPDMRTKEIVIRKDAGGRIRHISIHNETENTLYTSSEQLDYFPDSLYRISKKQQVLIIGTNNYSVKGRIIKEGIQ